MDFMDLFPKLPGSEIGKMWLAPTPRQAMVGATPRDGRKLSQSCAGGLRVWKGIDLKPTTNYCFSLVVSDG